MTSVKGQRNIASMRWVSFAVRNRMGAAEMCPCFSMYLSPRSPELLRIAIRKTRQSSCERVNLKTYTLARVLISNGEVFNSDVGVRLRW